MLKRKAFRKIIITSFSLIIILLICLFPNDKKSVLNSKVEVEYVSSLSTDSIYLLGKNNYLVKTQVLLSDDGIENKIKSIIEYLIIGNNKLPSGLTGIISKNTIINEIKVKDKIAYIDFNNSLFENKKDEKIIESLTYSICELKEIDGISLSINDERIDSLPNIHKKIPSILNKEYGINKQYNITNRENISKVTMYYLENIEDNNYYVPVTSYINDDREKIDIIIETLSSNYLYDSNLMSLLKNDIKLMDYQIEDEMMLLNFNDSFTDNKLLEETSYMIAYSIFDNYKVNSVLFENNGEKIEK